MQRPVKPESRLQKQCNAFACWSRICIRCQSELPTTVVRNADNPQLLEKMKSKLLELELKRTELLTKYEPTYRLVQEVDQQIAEAKASIAAEEQAPLRDQTTEPGPNHGWAKAELM